MIWFYLVNDRAMPHHRYCGPIPAFWAAMALVALPVIALAWRAAPISAAGLLPAVLLHLVLDSVAGDILWDWPWSDRFFYLITVPANHSHWVLTFLRHPVALIELTILAAAALLWRHNQRSNTP